MIQLTPDKLCLVLLNEDLGDNTFRFLVNRPIDEVQFILFRLDKNEGVTRFIAAQAFENDTGEGAGTIFTLDFTPDSYFPYALGRIGLTLAEYLEVSESDTLLVRAKDAHSNPVQLTCVALDDYCNSPLGTREGYYSREDYDNDVVIDLEEAIWGDSRATGTNG